MKYQRWLAVLVLADGLSHPAAGAQTNWYDCSTLVGDGKNTLEGTVDGMHPTDLGMVHQATAMEKALRPILAAPSHKSNTTEK
jgi:hypothetical protein